MTGKSESAVQSEIRVRAAELGLRLWRNNSGACEDKTGRLIRYGLANDSAQMNRRVKSGDLIGWVVYVGCAPRNPRASASPTTRERTAVLVSGECKREDWFKDHDDPLTECRARFNDREEAQAKWIDMIRADGGIAGFWRSVAEFERCVGL